MDFHGGACGAARRRRGCHVRAFFSEHEKADTPFCTWLQHFTTLGIGHPWQVHQRQLRARTFLVSEKDQRSPSSILRVGPGARAAKRNWEQFRHLIFRVSLRQGCGSSECSARRHADALRDCGAQRESRLPSRCAQAGCLLVHVGVPTPAGCACRHPLVVNCTLCCGPCDCMSQFDTGLL